MLTNQQAQTHAADSLRWAFSAVKREKKLEEEQRVTREGNARGRRGGNLLESKRDKHTQDNDRLQRATEESKALQLWGPAIARDQHIYRIIGGKNLPHIQMSEAKIKHTQH